MKHLDDLDPSLLNAHTTYKKHRIQIFVVSQVQKTSQNNVNKAGHIMVRNIFKKGANS